MPVPAPATWRGLPHALLPATATDTQPKVEIATTTDTQDRDEKPTGEVLTGEVNLTPLLPPSRPKDHPPGQQDVQFEKQSSSMATLSSASKDNKPTGKVLTGEVRTGEVDLTPLCKRNNSHPPK